jgi:hypothetical protein
MTPEQLAWRPEGRPEAKWSAAEILEHLSLTFASTSKLLGRSLRAERLEVPPATRSQKLATLVVVGLGHMPKGRKAPEFTRPRGADPQTAPHDIQKNLHAMRGVIDECERRFGRRAKIALHAILGPLTAPQWRKFHWVHTRHHMRQIAALRRSMARPPARQ